MVYATDKNRGCVVKIAKRGSGYAVYPLKQVTCKRKSYKDPVKGTIDVCKFEFEKDPRDSYHSKPYEDRDVSNLPNVFLGFVKRWCPGKIKMR